jgi:putative nucleotidyltransferase with HDIG domain
MMPTLPGQAAYDAEDLWVHSLAVSCAAEALAERAAGVDKGFVSTLGLLHDIGKLAINSYFPASAKEIRTRSPEFPDESFLDRERRVLGADHAEIGAMLAVHWKLPADLVEAIRWHHDPAAAPETLPESVVTASVIVHAANQLAKYCYVYSENMEIDIVPDALLRRANLPAPLPRLLGNRVRRAISRAVFFADDSTTRQPLGAIRRFLRLAERPKVPSILSTPARHEPQVGWAEADWIEKLAPGATVIDCGPASTMRLDRMVKSAGRRARLTSRCTAGGVERLLNSSLAHQETLGLDERDRLAARFVLRRLLPNLSEIAASEEIEVVQAFDAGVLTTAVCSPALRFAARFGEGVDARAARQVVHAELANVLNLRWFTRVLTPREGGALIFVSQVG